MSADSGPGTREVAHRIFAAEFDDADLSYSESDEERAPNFVVTPTGARVNRLFAVGVLTEVESVNEETLRGRVVDSTGAFVTYAGQYQPDEQSFLGRTSPPQFVAMTGKARTFEPEDSDVVYTSVRPESLSAVDADTRDRWTVSAAEATLHRIAVFEAALESGLTGEKLRAALEHAGVDDALAAGVPKAIDHYGTTETYLEAVRSLAVEALEQIAGERDDVRALEATPRDGGPADLGPLPAVDLDLVVPEGMVEEEADEAADEEADAEEPTAASEDATEEDAATADAADDSASTDAVEVDAPATGEPAASDDVPTEEPDASTPDAADPAAEADEAAPDAGSATPDASETPSEEPVDATESAGDDLGDFDAGDPAADTATGLDADAADETDSDADLGDFDADADLDDEDALTEAEREEVESEFGTDFSTGSEVDGPGEAGIDVPSSDEDLEDLEAETAEAEPAADTEPSTDSAGEAAESTTRDVDSAEQETDDAEAESQDADDGDEPAEDVDVDTAVLDSMKELDDGDGADREQVVAAVVDDTGADPGAVEDAIQDALMSGQCYEPADGKLKAI